MHKRHYKMKCDGCSKAVTGVKYNCLQCNDIVFCVHCQRGGTHNHHTLVEVTSVRALSLDLPLFSLDTAVNPAANQAMSPPHDPQPVTQRGLPETEKELWTLEPVKTPEPTLDPLPPVPPPRTSAVARTDVQSYLSVVDSEHDPYTVKWVPAKSTVPYRRSELSDTDPEFQAVMQNVDQMGGKNFTKKVIMICRIENFRLYKTYKSYQEYMTHVNDPGTVNERILWHGTSVDVVGNVYRDGFNRSYCGKNATAFGNGVYFATSFDYSASPKYSPPDNKGQKYIFQCRVLTGHFTKGEQDLKEPPMRTPEFRYDSVVDDMSAPAMFVVFKDMQVYPEYVITLKL